MKIIIKQKDNKDIQIMLPDKAYYSTKIFFFHST